MIASVGKRALHVCFPLSNSFPILPSAELANSETDIFNYQNFPHFAQKSYSMTHKNPHKSSQNHFIPDEIHGKTILTTVSDKKSNFFRLRLLSNLK